MTDGDQRLTVRDLDTGEQQMFEDATLDPREPNLLLGGTVLEWTSSRDWSVHFWDLVQRRSLAAITGSQEKFLEFSSDGVWAVFEARMDDATVTLVDVRSGSSWVLATDGDLFAPNWVGLPMHALSPWARRIAIPRRNAAGVWLVDVPAHRVEGVVSSPACDDAVNVAWSPTGSILAVGTLAGEVCLFDADTRGFLRSFHVSSPHGGPPAITLMQFTADG
jgi:WD40 repeat protein